MEQKSLRQISMALFIIYLLNLCLPCSLSFNRQAEGAVSPMTFIDIEGHWAEKEIQPGRRVI